MVLNIAADYTNFCKINFLGVSVFCIFLSSHSYTRHVWYTLMKNWVFKIGKADKWQAYHFPGLLMSSLFWMGIYNTSMSFLSTILGSPIEPSQDAEMVFEKNRTNWWLIVLQRVVFWWADSNRMRSCGVTVSNSKADLGWSIFIYFLLGSKLMVLDLSQLGTCSFLF